MEYQVLYRKYRPHNFDTLVGQNYIKRILKNCVINGKFSHAYIFTGPRGTGKTSTAKIFAKAINCLNPIDGNPCNECTNCKNFETSPDIVELDAASNNGVDDIREIISNVRLAPSSMKVKVYIIDEFHMLSTSAFNALLLTLEEPPANVVFILATTDIQSVPITVLSRCQRFDFRPIALKDIQERLKYVCLQENLKVEEDAIKEIAMMSNGGLRDALSILDQVATNSDNVSVEDVISNLGCISNKKVKELIVEYENNNIEKVLEQIKDFKDNGVDFRLLVEKLIFNFKSILIDIKLDKYNGKLDFDNVYELIFELTKLLGGVKTSIDYYDLLKIVFLKYINYFPGNNLMSEKVLESKLGNEKNTYNHPIINNIKENESINVISSDKDKSNIENEQKDNINNEVKNSLSIANAIEFDIDVRINNTFVNAQKQYLLEIKEKWSDFISYESNANKNILSCIVDTSVVAASDKYVIFVNNMDASVDLLNINVKSLEKDFNLFYNKSVHIVTINSKKWDVEKNNYIIKKKNGYKYEIIDNDIIVKENKSELEKVAKEIFGNNYTIE